jgi:hypothetical protein
MSEAIFIVLIGITITLIIALVTFAVTSTAHRTKTLPHAASPTLAPDLQRLTPRHRNRPSAPTDNRDHDAFLRDRRDVRRRVCIVAVGRACVCDHGSHLSGADDRRARALRSPIDARQDRAIFATRRHVRMRSGKRGRSKRTGGVMLRTLMRLPHALQYCSSESAAPASQGFVFSVDMARTHHAFLIHPTHAFLVHLMMVRRVCSHRIFLNGCGLWLTLVAAAAGRGDRTNE